MARAGIEGRTQLRRNLLAFNKSVKNDVRKDAVENALVAGIIAKNTGQNTIATTPSDLSIEPKGNRIWTGQMYEDFDADVTQRGTNITVKFGWIRRKQKYYGIQEHGGTVPTRRGNIQVSAMHALTNSLVAVQRHLDNKGIK
jgi:hypothetical protein